ncbi:hypothetical protein Ahy_B05g075844 [Arachis hypogaea]|uniref:SWIM-type domain-containing protein n=1 Tax=Arachis hypogaea TaxID=3818 RepID=A0A444Z243_ARAHY|nr:hypothetical protein Ahy_B05g075844 [Arachis hypogaea]
MHSTLDFTAYEVVEQVSNSIFNKYVIIYDAISRKVKCQCLLFESRGILCRHSLIALSFERSKNIKRRHTYQEQPRRASIGAKKQEIQKFYVSELTGILHRAFDNVMAEMQEYQAKSKGKSSLSHEDATLSDVNELQSPHVLEQEVVPRTDWDQIWKKNCKCNKEKEKLNILDDGSMIQSSSNLYDPQDMNYPREDYRSFSFY